LAGIGFELKKLFPKKGILQSAKAFGYASVICAGPMLLGVLLLLGIMLLCTLAGVYKSTRELIICMITYTLLASLFTSSFFSMVVTRYTADMLYEDKKKAVLPSFWGSSTLMMAVGSVLYGLFLLISGASFMQQFLCFIFFNELIITWNAMSYLSAIKDYKGIFLSFLSAVALTFIVGAILLLLKVPVTEAMLCSITVGYGVMLIWDVVLLHKYFPDSDLSPFTFLKWIDEFLPLAFSGLFINIGMFSHLVIMWFSDIGVRVHGLFFGAPFHDVPALLAFMTTLVTTVNFVVSVEVNFYPKYRIHYSLYNDKGTIGDIKQAENEMLETLKTEIFYTSLKQLLTTALCIAIVGNLVPIPFLIVFTRRVFQWLKTKGRLGALVEKLENRAAEKSEIVLKYAWLGLCILVAIPLPGTGAWTGALVAAVLNMRLKKAMPAIVLGVLIAGFIVTCLTYGVTHLLG